MVFQVYLLVHWFLLIWISFAASKADVQEKETEVEVDEVFWNTKIIPILHQLEKGNTKSFCFKLRKSSYFYVPHCPDIFSTL